LSFSGGADSLTALHSFVDNNIHLDEIVVVDYFDGSNYDDPMK
jgi:diphthamide synthase (EF-2-diphthine--ammonia ligase)